MRLERFFNKGNFKGAYAEALFLWANLPSNCKEVDGVTCGNVNFNISRKMSNLLELDRDKKYFQANIAAYANHQNLDSRAWIMFKVDRNAFLVHIKSRKVNEEDKKRKRKVELFRSLSEGDWEEIEDIKTVDSVFKEIKKIGNKLRRKRKKESVCRSCAF